MSVSNLDTGTLPAVKNAAKKVFAAKKYYISLILPGEETQFFDIPEEKALVIGRSHEANIVINSNSVSRKHAQINLKGHEVIIEDLGSRNGTWKNGKRIPMPTTLQPGDEASIGTAMVAIHEVAPWTARHEGLLEHDNFIERLHQEIDRKRLTKKAFSVAALVFPREHFASSVDLMPIYYRLREILRPMIVIGHYGASIIVILLPEHSKNESKEIVKQVRNRFKKLKYEVQSKVLSFPADAQGLDQLLGQVVRLALDKETNESVSSEFSIAELLDGDDIRSVAGHSFVVASEKMRHLFDTVDKAAKAPISVVIYGETGVGKERIAEAIHEGGERKEKPLIKINCAALPEQLLESELFGHTQGAFTGALKNKKGLFEEAGKGSVFLDEIGEMPTSLQVKLLRVLQEKSFRRVGDVTERPFDARIIAATNKDLEEQIKNGNFREDLYYRLNGLSLFVPPLRERTEEIEPLVHLFIQDAAQQIGRRVDGVSESAIRGLKAYAWPGNIRELKNVIERAVLISDGPTLDAQSFSKTIVYQDQDIASETSSIFEESDLFEAGLWQHVESLEKRLIKTALENAANNKSEAARLLQIPRKTLLLKIKKYQLNDPGGTTPPL